MKKRRICWPNPDATCLEGGCIHCNDHPFRSLKTIENYAIRSGTLSNRATGQKSAWAAWCIGLNNDFFNAETK